jgi:hypothetical protein
MWLSAGMIRSAAYANSPMTGSELADPSPTSVDSPTKAAMKVIATASMETRGPRSGPSAVPSIAIVRRASR